MKSRFILVTVLTVLTSAWSAFGQTGGTRPWTIFTGTSDKTAYRGSEMSLIPTTGFNTNLIAADRLKVGDMLQVNLSGHFNAGSNNASSTLTLKFKAGKYVIANTAAMLINSNGVAAAPVPVFWRLMANATCRTNGATGFLIGDGLFQYEYWSGQTNLHTYPLTNIYGLIVGTTTNIALDVTATFTDLGYGVQTNKMVTQNAWIGLTR